MSSSTKLNVDSFGLEVSTTLYRSIIGSLLYLTASRSDIAFSVGVCARYQAASKESHLTVVKRIIRYVNGTRIMACGTQRTLMLVLLVIRMSIGLEVWMIERVLQVVASIL